MALHQEYFQVCIEAVCIFSSSFFNKTHSWQRYGVTERKRQTEKERGVDLVEGDSSGTVIAPHSSHVDGRKVWLRINYCKFRWTERQYVNLLLSSGRIGKTLYKFTGKMCQLYMLTCWFRWEWFSNYNLYQSGSLNRCYIF